MEITYKYKLTDFEIIKHNKLERATLTDTLDLTKPCHVVEYEIYLKKDYFTVGNYFGLTTGTLYRGAPQARLSTIKLVNDYLKNETGINPDLKD